MFLATLILGASGIIQTVKAPTATKFYIDPGNCGMVTAGTTLVLNIMVDNVIGLNGWEFELRWDNWVLSPVSVSFGPFLSQNGAYPTIGTSYISAFKDSCGMNEWMLTADTTSGSGRLATVTLLATGAGTTDISFSVTKLKDILVHDIDHQTFGSKASVHIAAEAESVWPESGLFIMSEEPDDINTLYAEVRNHDPKVDVEAYVKFIGFGMDGSMREFTTNTETISGGTSATLSTSALNVTATGGPGVYRFYSRAYFSYGGQYFNGFKEKHLKFQVRA